MLFFKNTVGVASSEPKLIALLCLTASACIEVHAEASLFVQHC